MPTSFYFARCRFVSHLDAHCCSLPRHCRQLKSTICAIHLEHFFCKMEWSCMLRSVLAPYATMRAQPRQAFSPETSRVTIDTQSAHSSTTHSSQTRTKLVACVLHHSLHARVESSCFVLCALALLRTMLCFQRRARECLFRRHSTWSLLFTTLHRHKAFHIPPVSAMSLSFSCHPHSPASFLSHPSSLLHHRPNPTTFKAN